MTYDANAVLRAMRDTMIHGGPDDSGIFVDREDGVALGNRRLAIVDLSVLGRQPMSTDDGRMWITYNGEVYNFREIRSELERAGHKFHSGTDTEVVLKAFLEWGSDALRRFRGMWAFGIWDRATKTLLLARDRVGVKPVYWHYRDGFFAFASELKALHQHPRFDAQLNREALALYLQLGYIPSPFTIFNHTYKLKPGHALVVRGAGPPAEVEYWDAVTAWDPGVPSRNGSVDEIAEELDQLMRESFKLRLVADVPVGVFLSGGIDSSLVTAILAAQTTRKLKTFTVGFEDSAYDEARWARGVAQYLGTEHHEINCTVRDAEDVLRTFSDIYDEPFADTSAIPTCLLAKFARGQVKVALSADGGDELFCGYPKYEYLTRLRFRLTRRRRPAFLVEIARALGSRFGGMAVPFSNRVEHRYFRYLEHFSKPNIMDQWWLNQLIYSAPELKCLAGLDPGEGCGPFMRPAVSDDLAAMMLGDFEMFLPDDILVKVDRATMSVGLENRDPFLDHKLVEYAFRLPVRYKYHKGRSKYVVRRILERYLPTRLFHRPKMGFGSPVREWFHTSLSQLYREYLSTARLTKEGIFEPECVSELLSRYLNGDLWLWQRLWVLFVFQLWTERWRTVG